MSSSTGNGDLVLALAVGAAAAAVLAADYVHTPFDPLFEAQAARTGVPADLLRALARHESSFRPDAVSPKNTNGTRDYGLMQVNEATAAHMGRAVAQLLDPAYNVTVAADVLASLHRELGDRFSLWTWIAAYNAGSPAILRRGVFNVAYSSDVMWHYQLYQLAGLVRGRNAAPSA